MKYLAAVFAAVFGAAPCVAQPTTFDPVTGIVDVPCVQAFDGSKVVGVYAPYRARMRKQPAALRFTVEQIAPTTYDTDCSGHVDTSTGVYTDTVNIGENSYDIRMRRGAGNAFSLESATLRGPATTSVWIARNGANTVYLAGTIHILRNSDYPLPRAYDAAYARSSALYFEVDMDDPLQNGDGLTAAQVRQQVTDPQGRTLTQVLTPENYTALGSHMQQQGLTIDGVGMWSAQMLINALSYRQLDTQHGFTAGGVDAYIANRAILDRKGIYGLETSATQTLVLQSMNEGYENEIVQEFLGDVTSGSIVTDTNAMVSMWRSGNTTAIYREAIAPRREVAYNDYLLLHANRNRAWLPQIEALLQTPATEMVVVGVAHMAGDEGLVQLLRARGYTVEKY